MSIVEAIEIALYVSPITLLLGVSLGLYYFKYLEPAYRVLLIYFGIALLADVVSRLLSLLYNDNLILIPIFALVEMVIFSWLYYRYLLPGSRALVAIVVLVASCFILTDIFYAIGEAPVSFQSYGMVIDHLAITLLAFLYFKNVLTSDAAGERPYMSFNAAVFLFFSVTMLFYLPVNFLVNVDSEVKFYFWALNFVFTVIFYTYLTYLIWKNGRTRRLSYFG